MILEIGVMIGFYIITKMISLYEKNESATVKTFCCITTLVAGINTTVLIIRGLS